MRIIVYLYILYVILSLLMAISHFSKQTISKTSSEESQLPDILEDSVENQRTQVPKISFKPEKAPAFGWMVR